MQREGNPAAVGRVSLASPLFARRYEHRALMRIILAWTDSSPQVRGPVTGMSIQFSARESA